MQTPAQFAGRGAKFVQICVKANLELPHYIVVFNGSIATSTSRILLSMIVLMASPAIDVLGQPWQFFFLLLAVKSTIFPEAPLRLIVFLIPRGCLSSHLYNGAAFGLESDARSDAI